MGTWAKPLTSINKAVLPLLPSNPAISSLRAVAFRPRLGVDYTAPLGAET
jgi:hypothetical protein